MINRGQVYTHSIRITNDRSEEFTCIHSSAIVHIVLSGDVQSQKFVEYTVDMITMPEMSTVANVSMRRQGGCVTQRRYCIRMSSNCTMECRGALHCGHYNKINLPCPYHPLQQHSVLTHHMIVDR